MRESRGAGVVARDEREDEEGRRDGVFVTCAVRHGCVSVRNVTEKGKGAAGSVGAVRHRANEAGIPRGGVQDRREAMRIINCGKEKAGVMVDRLFIRPNRGPYRLCQRRSLCRLRPGP